MVQTIAMSLPKLLYVFVLWLLMHTHAHTYTYTHTHTHTRTHTHTHTVSIYNRKDFTCSLSPWLCILSYGTHVFTISQIKHT